MPSGEGGFSSPSPHCVTKSGSNYHQSKQTLFQIDMRREHIKNAMYSSKIVVDRRGVWELLSARLQFCPRWALQLPPHPNPPEPSTCRSVSPYSCPPLLARILSAGPSFSSPRSSLRSGLAAPTSGRAKPGTSRAPTGVRRLRSSFVRPMVPNALRETRCFLDAFSPDPPRRAHASDDGCVQGW